MVSALGHTGFLAFALLVLPNWLHSATVPPPSMTVKIVDNIPAGDLGTHLPKLAGHKKPPPEEVAKADEPPPPEEKPPEPPKPDNDKNAVALNTIGPTPTPTPEPPPPTEAPTLAPTAAPTPTETPKKIAEPAPTPEPPQPAKPKHHEKVAVHNPPKPKHSPVQMAKAEKTPDTHEQFRKLQEQMLKQRIEMAKKDEGDEDEDSDDEDTPSAPPSSSDDTGERGPVASNANSAGSGYGVGSGTGSVGTLTDLQYLLYFRTVQQKVKDAWTFPGGSNDLSADVEFSIGADGSLNGVKIAKSSGDSAFDESVIRAIRRAAPFPPPPDRYRSQFSDVVSTFKLGELKS